MGLLKIWERYFIGQFLKTLFLFLFGFYTLYLLLDYASHSNASYHHSQMTGKELVIHYLSEFSLRLEILLPFAVLIATIKTLTSLNLHYELVALLTSGASLKRLLLPLFLLSLLFTGLLYVNAQFFIPPAENIVKSLHEKKRVEKKKKEGLATIQHLLLQDESVLIFQQFDSQKNRFFDAYWMPSNNELYRIKYLYPSTEKGVPVGEYVDHFLREQEGTLSFVSSSDHLSLDKMVFNPERLNETLIQPEELSLTTLYQKMPPLGLCKSDKECHLVTVFYHKLATPWLSFFAFIGIAPFCIRFSRTLSPFFIYALGTCALVMLYLIIEAASVLGERQVLTPFEAIGVPFFLLFTFLTAKFFTQT